MTTDTGAADGATLIRPRSERFAMTHVRPADAAITSEILELEARRRQALIDVDMEALDDLYDESLIHIHAPGLTHTKAQLMEHTATRRPYVDMSRGLLHVRVIGDVAIVTGPLTNVLRNPDGGQRTMTGQVTQVVRRCEDGKWRYVSFQMTPETAQVWGDLPSQEARAARRDAAASSTPASSTSATSPEEN